MKKILRVSGFIVILAGILFLLVGALVVISDGEKKTDVFGLTIPETPTWTGYIPFLGYGIGLVFESFSLHGLVVITVFGILISFGYAMIHLSKVRVDRNTHNQGQQKLFDVASKERTQKLVIEALEEAKEELDNDSRNRAQKS